MCIGHSCRHFALDGGIRKSEDEDEAEPLDDSKLCYRSANLKRIMKKAGSEKNMHRNYVHLWMFLCQDTTGDQEQLKQML